MGASVAQRIETVDRLSQASREAVDELIREATAVDGVPPVGEHKYLKLYSGGGSVWALLAYDGERIEGYAQVLQAREMTAELVVRPRSRGRGLGERLMGAVCRLARASGAAELKLWAYGSLAPGAALAARHGLSPSRTLLQLERPLEDLPALPPLDGYAIRPFAPARDHAAWLRLHNAVFANHPENGTWSSEDLAARLGQRWFSADDFLITEAGGRMVGFNWLKRVPDSPAGRPEGEIYIIGVDGSERGRGLGRALAILGLHHLRQHGIRVCTLYVEGDNVPALKLYGALDFTVRHTHHCYTLPLPAPADEPSRHAARRSPNPVLVVPGF